MSSTTTNIKQILSLVALIAGGVIVFAGFILIAAANSPWWILLELTGWIIIIVIPLVLYRHRKKPDTFVQQPTAYP